MKTKGEKYVKLLDQYKKCISCKKVLVKRVYKGYDFVPLCMDCRKIINKNKGGD